MITGEGTEVRIKSDDLSGRGQLFVKAVQAIRRAELCVWERDCDRKQAFSFSGCGRELCAKFCVEDAKIWSLTSPVLYDYSLRLEYEHEEETADGTFGFRVLSSDERNIYLNGRPIFIKGYIRGAAAHEHGNVAGLSEREFFRKNIRQAKKFGFNLVRFHSVVPSEEFMNAADELGMLVHMELRQPSDIYNNISEMVTTGNFGVGDDYIRRTIAEKYDHPSLAVYCIGNEIRNAPKERIEQICVLIRELDPTRLFTDTCAWGKIGRPYIDLDVQHMGYFFPYGKHADMFSDTYTLTVSCEDENMPVTEEGRCCTMRRSFLFSVPLVAHEVCHYTALRDFERLREKFAKSGAEEPWWIGEELKMIGQKGYSEEYPRMYEASKYFQYECWKTAFETLRASKILGGFHFLQFADTDRYENSNGVVDCFDDETYTDSEKFLKFNGDRVLLASMQTRLFYGGEEIEIPIGLSDWGEEDRERANLLVTLSDAGGRIYAQGRLPNADISERGLHDLGKVTIRLPEVREPQEMCLRAELADGEETYCENDWKIWVYARRRAMTYAEFTSFEGENAVITDSVEKAFCALESGKRVCLIYRSDWTRHVRRKDMERPAYAFRATWNRFKPVIWDRGTNYGGLCERELLCRYGFATGSYYDFNYSVITEDCDKIILDDFPGKVRSLVTGIDKNVRDRFDVGKDYFGLPELMYDRTLRRFSYLFETGVGNGRLLVCGLNLTGLDVNEPSSVAAADFVMRYLVSEEFAPERAMTVKELKEYMKCCALKPVKERMMTQYWELDDAPVESKQYWRESREYLTEKE